MKTPIFNELARAVARGEDLSWDRGRVQALVDEVSELKASHKTLAAKVTRAPAGPAGEIAELRQKLATAETVAANLREREQARIVSDVRALAQSASDAGDMLSASVVLSLVDDHKT